MEDINLFTGILFPYINFFLFLFLLIKFAKKPLNQFAQNSYKNFLKLVQESASTFEKVSIENKNLKHRIENLNKEIQELHEQSIKKAVMRSQEINNRTQYLAESFKKEIQQKIQTQIQNYIQKLKEEILYNTINIVKQKIDKEDQNKLILKNINYFKNINITFGKDQ